MRIEATEIGETKGQPATDTLRRCAVTRVQRPKDDLIRFVLGPDGTVVPDLKEKLPGRGVWLTAAHETVAQAVKRKVFSRALKAEAKAGLSDMQFTDAYRVPFPFSKLVRERLGVSAEALPLACVLEGGSWAAGRALAQELRGGLPPLTVISDGTVF